MFIGFLFLTPSTVSFRLSLPLANTNTNVRKVKITRLLPGIDKGLNPRLNFALDTKYHKRSEEDPPHWKKEEDYLTVFQENLAPCVEVKEEKDDQSTVMREEIVSHWKNDTSIRTEILDHWLSDSHDHTEDRPNMREEILTHWKTDPSIKQEIINHYSGDGDGESRSKDQLSLRQEILRILPFAAFALSFGGICFQVFVLYPWHEELSK